MRTLALATCLLLAPSIARARSVVVVIGDAPDPAELRAAVIEAIAERGVRLVRTPDGEICDADPVPCAAALAARTGADAALRVDRLDGEPPRVRLRLVGPEGDASEAEEPIAEGDLSGATARALARVLEAAPSQHGFLVVRSIPAGARVEVDGEPRGTTPVRLTLSPGEHSLRLVHPEAGAHEEPVEVVADAEVSVSPRIGADVPPPEAAVAAAPLARRSEPSPFNWLIGGALAIGGVVALISPLSTIAREGQCEEAIEDVGCVEMVRVGPQTGVLLGVGLALLVSAVVFDAVAPIRVDVTASAEEVRVGVRGTF